MDWIYYFIIFISVWIAESVIGNAILISIVARHKKMRTSTNFFICNVALADIVLAGIVLPQNLHDLTHVSLEYYEGDFLCRVVNSMPLICIAVSIYTLVAMCHERYLVTLSVLGARVPSRVAKFICGCTWLLALIVVAPTMYEYREYSAWSDELNVTLLSCGNEGLDPTFIMVNGFLLLVVAYIVPLVWMVVSYTKVVFFIRSHSNETVATLGANGQRSVVNRNKVKIVKMLVTVTTFFAISWLPYFISLIFLKATGQDDFENLTGPLNLLRITLLTFSTDYNKYIYIIFNKSFRKGFKDAVCRPCIKAGWLEDDVDTSATGNTFFDKGTRVNGPASVAPSPRFIVQSVHH